ncbi:MAG TPA: hypothetical protein VGL72_32940 [Bryobacteraceae bacterium]
MSYLDSPRLHFRGWFQADVSTINNDVTAYDINSSAAPDPGWNPEGTAIFRLVNCAITGAFLHGRLITTSSEDPAIGMSLQNANQRAPGKLVDLDPQQQMVSMIFGMQVRLVSASLATVMQAEFKPAPFANLWLRQVEGPRSDQKVGANYQSVLEDISWPSETHSTLLKELRRAAPDGKLSIEFAVFGYGRDPSIPRYTFGHIVGTIGPWKKGEPEHFTAGRQMIAQGPPFGKPPAGVASLQAKVAQDGLSVTADLGNSFQIQNANSGFVDIGPLMLGVLTTNPDNILKMVPRTGVVILGEIGYRGPDWYTQTAGVQTFDIAKNPDAAKYLSGCPLVVVSPSPDPESYDVRLQESIDGVYVRADQFVFRIEPGESQTVEFHATRFGKPAAMAIALSDASGLLAQLGGTPPDIAAPPNAVNIPQSSGTPQTITSGPDGRASFVLKAIHDGPTLNGNPWPRGYLAGQLYALGYQLAQQPANYVSNLGNFVSILAYSKRYNAKGGPPTWYDDIEPLLAQYGKLYPIMNKYVVDLSDYKSVVSRLDILRLAFSLPSSDPNHMPVTRDLGKADRDVILEWLNMKGADGLPPLGTPRPPQPPTVQPATAAAAAVDLLPEQKAGKTAVILKFEKARAQAAERKQP